ncbi:hypothetical protein CBL_03448 [Carabus blaptoides fortunei]
MDHRLVCAVLFLLSVLVVESYADPANQVYSQLNTDEKKYFLQYFLAKGYFEQKRADTMSINLRFPVDLNIPEESLKKFEQLNIDPDNFAATFFRNFTQEYEVTDTVALNWARGEIVCFPDGNCIDSGDVGSICCT